LLRPPCPVSCLLLLLLWLMWHCLLQRLLLAAVVLRMARQQPWLAGHQQAQ
jgi:hypothetical protein